MISENMSPGDTCGHTVSAFGKRILLSHLKRVAKNQPSFTFQFFLLIVDVHCWAGSSLVHNHLLIWPLDNTAAHTDNVNNNNHMNNITVICVWQPYCSLRQGQLCGTLLSASRSASEGQPSGKTLSGTNYWPCSRVANGSNWHKPSNTEHLWDRAKERCS